MKKITGLMTLCFSLLFITQAHAFILDTGAPTSYGGAPSLYRPSSTVYQSLAGRVDLNQPYSIKSVETYFGQTSVSGNIMLSIYGDNGWLDSSNQIFSKNFYQANSFSGGWDGLLNENITLGAGSYWFAFEVNDPSVYSGVLMDGGVPNPLPAYTYINQNYATWQHNNVNPIALRLGGQEVVPEPASMFLLSLSLLGGGLIKRKFRSMK